MNDKILIVMQVYDLFCAGRNGIYLQRLINHLQMDNVDFMLRCVNECLDNHIHYPGGYKTLDIKLIAFDEIYNHIDCDKYDYIIYMHEDVVLWGDFITPLIESLRNEEYTVSVPVETFARNNECIWAFKSEIFREFGTQLKTISDGFYDKGSMMRNIVDSGYKICGVENINIIHYGN